MSRSELCTAQSQCVICNFPVIIAGVETKKNHLFSHASISNSCIRQTDAFEIRRLLLGVTREGWRLCTTVPFLNPHPLAELGLSVQESKSDGLGLPVGSPCLHLGPLGTRPTTGRALSPVEKVGCRGTVPPEGWPRAVTSGMNPRLTSPNLTVRFFNSHCVLLFLPINPTPNCYRSFIEHDGWSHPRIIYLGVK